MSAPIDADLSLGPAVELKEKNSDAPPLSSDKEMNADDHTIEFGAKPEETIDEGISTIATPALVHDFDDLSFDSLYHIDRWQVDAHIYTRTRAARALTRLLQAGPGHARGRRRRLHQGREPRQALVLPRPAPARGAREV